LKRFLKSLVKNRRLTPLERIANRIAYSGAVFIMISPYLLPDPIGAITYVIGGLLSIPQCYLAKQWNIVIVNLNVVFGYLVYLYS
tara:strand:+ start:121 stop:375 length:255 start_codon:yes stop_codon:yes gene_type:complete